MKKLTVFTPSYNRAYILSKCYESLLRQTSKDFIWLIIDDGSTDKTRELVDSWIVDNCIQIKYVYQDNLGMHGAHNTAYSLIETELNVCIDSDDFMPDEAVENILSFWNEVASNEYAGIIALDADLDGNVLGDRLPKQNSTTLNGFFASGGRGDKKLIYRTDIIKKYPDYGIYKGERLVPLGSKYLLIDQDFELLILNEVLCIVDYQALGSSNTIFRQYRESPRGFAEDRLIKIKYGPRFVDCIKASIHLVSSAIFCKDISLLCKSSKCYLFLFTIPLGIFLNMYIRLFLMYKSN